MDPARHRHAHRRWLGTLELPARGHLRARARTVGAFGFVETVAAFPLTPEITVQQPIVAQTTVLTTVAVPDGGTVLLGGVKRLSESRNMAGVPILNKIPYLSRLFKNTGVGRETQSLMLMVTPRIVILEEEESLLGIPQ